MKKSALKLHIEKIKRVLTTSYLIVLYFFMKMIQIPMSVLNTFLMVQTCSKTL